MDKQSPRFLRMWVVFCIMLTGLLAAFNVVMDPYMLFHVPRMAGFNAHKPAVDTQQKMMKAYEVLQIKPNTLVLGSSRAALGVDGQSPAWPARDRPIYNLALTAGGPYVAHRYLQDVLWRQHISLVVFGLEFEYFLTPTFVEATGREFESRLIVKPDGSVNDDESRQRLRDRFRAALSFDALTDSAVTLAANFKGESSDLLAGNWNWKPRVIAEMGSFPIFALADVFWIRWYPGRQRDPRVMADVKAILDLCESHGTRVILFISPSHADHLEILDLAGHWHAFEEWKRGLAALTAKYRDTNGRSGVTLWDFSGYDSYSTERVPTDRHVLHWFLDPAHYTKALGDVIVNRIFGEAGTQFGVLLTPETIEPHLAAIREQQRLYRERHQADAGRVRDLYNSIAVMSTTALAKVR
jgi:hypothetical protein